MRYAVDTKREVTIEKNCYAFNFLGATLVVYHNPKRRNTYGKNRVNVEKIILEGKNKRIVTFNSGVITDECAYAVRAGEFVRIDIYLS